MAESMLPNTGTKGRAGGGDNVCVGFIPLFSRLHPETGGGSAPRVRQDAGAECGFASDQFKQIQQNSVNVTFDPDTAHPSLIISEDGKQVINGETRQKLPDNPERIDPVVSLLGKEGFSSGRSYYEVQVKTKTEWSLGVANQSIKRKGTITLKPANGFWTVWLRHKQYTARADPDVHLNLYQDLQKVGVLVDYEEGQVSFYDAEAMAHIYSYSGQNFTETLYPYFSPSLNYGASNSAPLIITNFR
ncbi:hypothetical protein DPEC_G00098270 [Dallia pectoralis]|uniref:Uncharacterized protein n=1 Tax=Dallia pectoralis TaxID=75939 RepID=A0ACC2GWD6_DALPE|nr:hypothetical protein DPEC_G00098270 [Dallia pectoralis]